jgi:hypothetical protein
MSTEFSNVGIKLASYVWNFAKNKRYRNMSSLRNLIKRLPFLTGLSDEADLLLYQVLSEYDGEEIQIKDLDVTSQGRIESFTNREKIVATVKYINNLTEIND